VLGRSYHWTILSGSTAGSLVALGVTGEGLLADVSPVRRSTDVLTLGGVHERIGPSLLGRRTRTNTVRWAHNPKGEIPVVEDRTMKLRIFTEPQQGASYATLRAVARAAEDLGFDGFFRSDHYLKMGGVSGLPGPTDAWATLAALATQTSRLRLGTLMSSATFRLPGPLAITVAEVDEMSDGRVEFGFGAGWYEAEHSAYGIPFPPVGERFDRFEEQLAIITGLWETPVAETFSFTGKYYQLTDSPGLPKPAQSPRPPVIIGGTGPRRTPALAARYADEFNAAFLSPADSAALFSRVRSACTEAGRDPATMTFSAAQVVAVGRDSAEYERRAAAIGRDPATLRSQGLAGSPEEVAAKIAEFAEAGVTRLYLQVLDLSDLEHLDLLATLL
jgi:F420-dependent oxidoreductase-like protein